MRDSGVAEENPLESWKPPLLCNPSLPLLSFPDSRHKELAPLKYLALEEKLYKDPRLMELL